MNKPGAGRPRKPAPMKDLAGTSREDRKNQNAPVLKCEIPKKICRLGPQGRKAWEFLADICGPDGMRVLTRADAFSMMLFCQAWEGYVTARIELSKVGSVYETAKEEVIRDPAKAKKGPRGGRPMNVKSTIKKLHLSKHPLTDLAGSEREFLMQLLPRFGLTPSDRDKVSSIVDGGKDNPVIKILNGGKKRGKT